MTYVLQFRPNKENSIIQAVQVHDFRKRWSEAKIQVSWIISKWQHETLLGVQR